MDNENPRRVVNADRSVTVTLLTPIKVANEDVTSLTLRRLRGKEIRTMDKAIGNAGMTLGLIGTLAGIPPSSVDQIDGEDFTELAQVVAGFFGKSPATGEA
jgi:hypothetical protein